MQKNELRIKKEFDDFAKTVFLLKFSQKNQPLKFLSSMAISGTGKGISKAPMTLLTKVASFKSTFSFPQNIPTNLPRWNSILRFGTPIFPHKLVPSAWIFSRISGLPPWPFVQLYFLYKLCYACPSQTTPRTQLWLQNIRKIEKNGVSMLKSG